MNPDGTISWRELLDETTHRLAAAEFPSPGMDARRLVERASGLEGAELVLGLDRPATRRGVAHLDAMVARRLTGEPLQYVLGAWGFRELDLFVDPRVLIPRPETEQLVDLALEEVDRHDRSAAPVVVVDLGTGSGAIALSLAAERPGVEVWAVDSSPDALAVAQANLAGIGRSATRVRLARGEWFSALPADLRGRVDLVVSNPPYVGDDEALPDEVERYEPRSALRAGPDGTEALRAIVDAAPDWCAPGAPVLLELAPHQAEALARHATARGYTEVRVVPDLSSRARFLVARAPVRT